MKMRSKCSTEECDREVKSRGLCNKHYISLMRKGALPDGYPKKLLSSAERKYGRSRSILEEIRELKVTLAELDESRQKILATLEEISKEIEGVR